MCIYIYIYIYICIDVCICMYICIHQYIYIYIVVNSGKEFAIMEKIEKQSNPNYYEAKSTLKYFGFQQLSSDEGSLKPKRLKN